MLGIAHATIVEILVAIGIMIRAQDFVTGIFILIALVYCRSHHSGLVTVEPTRLDFPRASNLRWSVCKLMIANREKKDITVSKKFWG